MYPIVTTWTGASQPTSTNWATGQTTAQWIDTHEARALSNFEGEAPESIDSFTTSWTASDGPHTLTTDRKEGETDQELFARHFERVRAAMEEHPPIHN